MIGGFKGYGNGVVGIEGGEVFGGGVAVLFGAIRGGDTVYEFG